VHTLCGRLFLQHLNFIWHKALTPLLAQKRSHMSSQKAIWLKTASELTGSSMYISPQKSGQTDHNSKPDNSKAFTEENSARAEGVLTFRGPLFRELTKNKLASESTSQTQPVCQRPPGQLTTCVLSNHRSSRAGHHELRAATRQQGQLVRCFLALLDSSSNSYQGILSVD